MVLIERKLHEIHAEARRKKSESGEEVGVAGGGASRQEAAPKGFVRVDSVLEGSPAATAVSARCSCYDPTPSEPRPFAPPLGPPRGRPGAGVWFCPHFQFLRPEQHCHSGTAQPGGRWGKGRGLSPPVYGSQLSVLASY